MTDETNPCSNCGYNNRPGKKFCGGCGQPLVLVCPNCSTQNPPAARFCDECGTPLAAPAAAASPAPAQPPSAATASVPSATVVETVPAPTAQEERRMVTALFCDLVGFTPLTEKLDAEDVRDIQAEYFGKMSANIERFGGIVEKYAGDAVLALFGTPIAHEDDAERAVLCGLAMQADFKPIAERIQRSWEITTGIRVGVNTGEVIAGTWNASGRQDITVTGDALNTAARIQSAGNSGEVLAGLETMELTRRRIDYGERRDVTLKGKSGLVPIFPALGFREQFGERWETRGIVTPLVGREVEMGLLRDAWTRARESEGQLVTIVGEAGAGKSRLINEALNLIRIVSPARVLRARCLSYSQGISLWLVADLLRTIFDIKEQEDLDRVSAKLTGEVPRLLSETDAQTQAEVIDVVGQVLGLEAGGSGLTTADAQVRHRALIRSLRLLLGAVAARWPAVLILEDLHWLDTTSQTVLSEVLDDVPEMPLLVLAAQRPGWRAPWAEWEWTHRIALEPLGQEEAVVLAQAVLNGMPLSSKLAAYVTDRAGGNPFFLEELLRALRDTHELVEHDGLMEMAPGAEERLPATLTELLLARLDRLDREARRVTQVASVIGRNFAVRLLARIVHRDIAAVEPSLAALQQAEIAFPQYSADLEYIFKHVSMRDVAYNTLLQKRRRQLHLEAARAIAALYSVDEYVEMIAYHFSHTQEHAEAADWLERAGDRAASVYANETAVSNYAEARRRLEQIQGPEDVMARLDVKQGVVLMTAAKYDEALEVLQRAFEVYYKAQNLERAGRVAAHIGMALRYQGKPEEALARIEPMLAVLTGASPSEALAALNVAFASSMFLMGQYRDTLEAARSGAEYARAIGHVRLLGDAEVSAGTALLLMGQTEEALRALEAALPVVEEGGDYLVLWRTLNNLAVTCEKLGEMPQARMYTERALQIAERVGNPLRQAFILGNLGYALTNLGEWAEARSALNRAIILARSQGAAEWSASPLKYLGRLGILEGKWEEAEEHLEQSLAISRQGEDRQNQEMALTYLAELDLARGQPELARSRLEPLREEDDADLGVLLAPLARSYLELGNVSGAEETARRAVEHTREHREQVNLVDALWVEAMVLARQKRWEEAHRDLGIGLAIARAMQSEYQEARLLYEDGLVRAAQEDPERAQELLAQAAGIFQRLGAEPDLQRTRDALSRLFAQPRRSA